MFFDVVRRGGTETNYKDRPVGAIQCVVCGATPPKTSNQL